MCICSDNCNYYQRPVPVQGHFNQVKSRKETKQSYCRATSISMTGRQLSGPVGEGTELSHLFLASDVIPSWVVCMKQVLYVVCAQCYQDLHKKKKFHTQIIKAAKSTGFLSLSFVFVFCFLKHFPFYYMHQPKVFKYPLKLSNHQNQQFLSLSLFVFSFFKHSPVYYADQSVVFNSSPPPSFFFGCCLMPWWC